MGAEDVDYNTFLFFKYPCAGISNQTWRVEYDVSISHHIRIDEGHDKDEEETVSGCVRNFLGLNCELPWDARRSGTTYSECVYSEVTPFSLIVSKG